LTGNISRGADDWRLTSRPAGWCSKKGAVHTIKTSPFQPIDLDAAANGLAVSLTGIIATKNGRNLKLPIAPERPMSPPDSWKRWQFREKSAIQSSQRHLPLAKGARELIITGRSGVIIRETASEGQTVNAAAAPAANSKTVMPPQQTFQPNLSPRPPRPQRPPPATAGLWPWPVPPPPERFPGCG